ncbi:MAG: stage II sporulation protein M [Desulfotomaculum sp.]|nr:stage II sporulation protein M [Desulfotomaculum sp.]
MLNIGKIFSASLRANWLYLAIVLIFFGFGCCFGVMAVDYLDKDQADKLVVYLDSFIEKADQLNINHHQAVKNSAVNNIFIAAAIYLMGLTIFGIPMVLALLFFKGFTLGFTIGFLTKQKAWQGVIFAVLSVLPQNIFYIPALLIGAMASLSFSVLLVKRFFNNKLAVWPGFLGYSLLMMVVMAAVVGAGIVEAYLTPWLIKNYYAVTAN